MDYRPLGRTGVSVSQLCLGAMMFGAFGNTDHDASMADEEFPTLFSITTRRSRSSIAPWTPESISSTPPMATPLASQS